MTDLETNYTEEERELLISLPYRVGFWMHEADDAAGDEDDRKEMEAIDRSLRSMVGLYQSVPLIPQICRETLSRNDSWPAWQEQSLDILPECERVKTLLRAKATKKELMTYCTMLKAIATAVAQAAGEYDVIEYRHEGNNFFERLIGRLMGTISSTRREEELAANISASEDAALMKLSAALKLTA